MLVSQQLLSDSLRRRVLAAGLTWEETVAGAGANAKRVGEDERLEALVVVRSFVASELVASALEFTATLSSELQQAWYREFTRISFWAGDPRRLAQRCHFDHVSTGGAFGWLAPRAARDHLALKRLLKPLRTRGAFEPEDDVAVCSARAGASPRVLTLACAGEPLERYLVHLSHCLCESAIEGHLPIGSGLSLLHVAELEELPEEPRYLRVRPSESEPSRLRLYGVLG